MLHLHELSRGLSHEQVDRVVVTQPVAARNRVMKMVIEAVVGFDYSGGTALCSHCVTTLAVYLGNQHQSDRRIELGDGDGAQAGTAAPTMAISVEITSAATLPFTAIEERIPQYLSAHYWWAYIHPKAVKPFERQWLVNLILWGNYARLRDAALNELGERLPGHTLQVACVYGDLTNRLSRQAARGGGAIDIIDVLPIQLQNLRAKLSPDAPVRLLTMDATDLKLPDGYYDRALIFFFCSMNSPTTIASGQSGRCCAWSSRVARS